MRRLAAAAISWAGGGRHTRRRALVAILWAAAALYASGDVVRHVPRALVSPDGLESVHTLSSEEACSAFEEAARANLLSGAALATMTALLEAADVSASVEFRNNVALAYLLAGETLAADASFAALATWCGWNGVELVGSATMSPRGVDACLAIFKNWCWTLAARPAGGDHALWAAVRELATLKLQKKIVLAQTRALSVYDTGLAGRVCQHTSIAPLGPIANGVQNGDAANRLSHDELYLDLLRRSLTNYVHSDFEHLDEWQGAQRCPQGSATSPVPLACEQAWTVAWRAAGVSGLASGTEGEEAERARRRYHTTLSAADLLHLELLVRDLFVRRVPGNLLEAGVFRGGACIFLRGLLQAVSPLETDRAVYVADSFTGIPPPRSAELPESGAVDPTADWTDRFEFGLDSVKYNFRRYGLLDRRVVFVPGLFNESMPPRFGSLDPKVSAPPDAPIFALLRIDADAFDGVHDALNSIYPRLSPGGAIVIDDWHLAGAREAVHAFRRDHNIRTPILPIPSDFLHTCTANLSGFDAGEAKTTSFSDLLYIYNKHLITGIGQHAAYWLKPE